MVALPTDSRETAEGFMIVAQDAMFWPMAQAGWFAEHDETLSRLTHLDGRTMTVELANDHQQRWGIAIAGQARRGSDTEGLRSERVFLPSEELVATHPHPDEGAQIWAIAEDIVTRALALVEQQGPTTKWTHHD